MIRGELSELERLALGRVLVRAGAGLGAGALVTAEDRARAEDGVTLGLLSVPSSVPMLTQQGMAHLELLRLWGEVPRARLVASVTGSGATIWAYPSGGGRRRVASWRKAPVLLDYAEAFAPVGCSGRAECWSLAQAVDFAADRVLLLEAGGY